MNKNWYWSSERMEPAETDATTNAARTAKTVFIGTSCGGGGGKRCGGDGGGKGCGVCEGERKRGVRIRVDNLSQYSHNLNVIWCTIGPKLIKGSWHDDGNCIELVGRGF